jgi:hypothetical protein
MRVIRRDRLKQSGVKVVRVNSMNGCDITTSRSESEKLRLSIEQTSVYSTCILDRILCFNCVY